MGFQTAALVSSFLLVLKVCGSRGQAVSTTEVFTQSVSPTPGGQIVIPAIIKPILQPEPFLPQVAPPIPSFGNFPSSIPPPLPPIILRGGNDRKLSHLLYFLIFAMNRGSGCNGGYGGCSGCNGGYGGNGGCNGGYGCNGGCNGGYGCNGGCNGGYEYDCGCGGGCGCSNNYGYSNGCGVDVYNGYGEEIVIQTPAMPTCSEQGNKAINLIITTDGCVSTSTAT